MSLRGVTLVVDDNGAVHAFSTDPDGDAWTTQQTVAGSADWTGWVHLGQPTQPLTGPTAAVSYDDELQLYAVGADGGIYLLVEGTWTTFGAPSGIQIHGLGAVTDATGTPWVFGVGGDGNLWSTQEASQTASTWSSLGAPSAGLAADGSLGAVLMSGGDLLVCAVGLDGNLYTLQYDNEGSAWGDWTSIGAPNTASFVGSAAAGAQSAGDGGPVWAIAVASDGDAWIASQSTPGAAWSAWVSLGSQGAGFVGDGPLGGLYADALYAAGVGGDGNLYVAAATDGSDFGPWQPLGAPLRAREPMFTSHVAELGAAGTLDLGSAIGISLDGNSPFSVGVWLRLTGQPHDPSILLQKGQELTVSLQGTQAISVQLGGASSMSAAAALQPGRWHYVLVTFSPSGQSDGSGTATVYLDGAQVGEPAALSGGAATSASFIVGGALHAQINNISMWSDVLTSVEKWIPPCWTAPPPGPTLAASFWFSQGAAVDTSGHGNALTLTADAAIVRLAPGLSLDGASFAKPGPLDPTSPGGGSAPFSVTAWVHPQAPRLPPPSGKVETVVFASGAMQDPARLICWLDRDKERGGFRWKVQRGETTVTASRRLPENEWSYVAVTYDGTTLTLYVDGVAAGAAASGALPARDRPLVTIGAAPDRADVQDFSGFFTGGIQAVGVWSQSLTAAQVAVFATTDPSTLGLPAPSAFYRFALGANAENTIAAVPVGLFQTATLGDFAVSAPASRAARPPRPGAVRHRPPRLQDLLEAHPPAREARPRSSLISPAGFDEMIASYARLLETLPEAQRVGLAEQFEQNLYRGARLQEAAGGPTPGMVTHARQGDELVFYYHGATGADEIARVSEGPIDPCTAWIIDIVATAIGLIASVIGVGFSVTKVVEFLIASIARAVVRSTLNVALAAVKVEIAATDRAIRLARAVYNGGLLASVVNEGLSGYTWWNWIFAAVGLVLNIVALWVTGGWWLAFMLAQLAFSITQLSWIIGHPPDGCKGVAELGAPA